MAYNKIEANGETLIDLTSDTVTADTLVSGRTAHLASGEKVTGTFIPVTGVKGNAESTYRKGDVNLTPANLGLGNVNNTSDLDKPISTATQAALDNQQGQINYNTNNGVKNLLNLEWFKTNAKSGQLGTVESLNIETGSITGYTPASTTNSYTAINIMDIPNQILENGKKYILSCTVDTLTNDGILGFRQVSNNTFISPINITGTGKYTREYTHNSSVPVYLSFCINTTGTSADKRIALSNVMLREATIDDDTFEPYAKSNAELTQDLDDISEELDCLTIQAALVNNEVVIQNTSDFTDELYGKYFSLTKPKFAILELHITSNTYYYKALINSSSVSHGNLMEASFITVNGGYMGIYNFRWNFSSTVGTPTVSYTSLNLGS